MFVPERVTTLTIAPDEMPYSAEYWFASTTYSRTASSEKPPRDDETIVSSLLTPSTRYELLRLSWPAVLTPPPPTPVTPGVMLARSRKLRVTSGIESRSLRVTVRPSVFLVVSTSGAAATTCTVSLTAATCSRMSMRGSCPVVSVRPERL